jgi:hypothetical protein
VCSTSSKEEDFDSLDECLEAYLLAEYIRSPTNPNKRQRVHDYVDKDMCPLAFVHFNTSLGKPKPVTIKALLDSAGASESLINKKYVSKLHVKNSNKTASKLSGVHQEVISTLALESRGNSRFLNFKTRSSSNGIYTWKRTGGAYDMIIG